jgi:hypothetical protein
MLFEHKGAAFSGLQSQLFVMIAEELKRECASMAAVRGSVDDAASDAYGFELASIVLSLSDSAIGQSKIGSPVFIRLLCSLLLLGTPRIQRQVRLSSPSPLTPWHMPRSSSLVTARPPYTRVVVHACCRTFVLRFTVSACPRRR